MAKMIFDLSTYSNYHGNVKIYVNGIIVISYCSYDTVISLLQVHLRRVMHKDRFMRRSSIVSAIGNRVWRDLIHNPLHLIFSVDVLGMTSSTLASLSKGFAELSTDGQFTHLRSKQVNFHRNNKTLLCYVEG